MSEFKQKQQEVIQKRIDACGRCQFCAGILAQPKKKIADFYDAMIDDSISGPVILEVISGWGILTSLTAVRHHRSGTAGYGAHMATIKKAAGR